MTSGVAGRYASALFDLAEQDKKVPAVAAALDALNKAINDSGDLSRLLSSPTFKTEDQLSALDALAKRLGIDGIALNFLKLMCDNRRLSALPDAIKQFQALVSASKGEAIAEVTSAEELSAAQLKDLKAALKERMGQDVQLLTKTDSSLLGGLVVKIGSMMIDNSLKTKLANLKVAMKGTG
jgi:F-type H+-transporting ATPase subunit delta